MFVMCQELGIELLLLLHGKPGLASHSASKLSMQCFFGRTIDLAFCTRFLEYTYNIWTVVSSGRNLKTECEEKYIFYYANSIVFCCNVKIRYPIQPSHFGMLKLLFLAKANQFL